MPKITPSQGAEKWSRRLGESTEDIRRGVEAVTESPMEKAAKNLEKAKRNYVSSIDSGKMAARLRAVPLSEWKDKMTNVGIPRVATGASAAQGKVASFFGELFPHIESGQTKIDAMPDVTIQHAKDRVSAWIDHMVQFKRS